MLIRTCIVGELETNCYLVGDDKEFFLVDPGSEPEKIMSKVKSQKSKVKAIICTHGHYDHIGAVAELKRKFKVPVYMHEQEKLVLKAMYGFYGVEQFKIDRWLRDGDIINFKEEGEGVGVDVGEVKLTVMHTPGHSPGSICLYNDEFVITGDTVFADGYLGRTDLPSGSQEEIEKSAKKVFSLPEKLVVYPGHGSSSSIGKERRLHGVPPSRRVSV